MQVKTSGIVLHSIKYTDSRSIITIYCREFGRVSYMVQGMNKKKSLCRAACLQPLSIVEIDVLHTPGRNIQRLKEIRMEHTFRDIPFDPIKNSLALFIAEALFRTLRQSEPDDSLYLFLENSLLQLDCNKASVSNFHLVFLLKLTRYLGFQPNQDTVQISYFDLMNGVFQKEKPLHSHYVQPEFLSDFISVLNADYSNMQNIAFTRSTRASVLSSILEYYQLHIPDFKALLSLPVLQGLFE